VIGEVASVVAVGIGIVAYNEIGSMHWRDEDFIGPVTDGIKLVVLCSPASAACGVCIAGNAQEQNGRYWAALLGGLVGLPVGLGVAMLGNQATILTPYLGVPIIIAGTMAPAIGATIGYDLSRSRGVESDVWQKRLTPPAVAVIPEHRAGRARTTRIDAKLLTLRF
jgi:hypothetical protein